MENPAFPDWLKFLQKVNLKIFAIWMDCKQNSTVASERLVKILNNSLKEDLRTTTWSSITPINNLSFSKNEPVTFAKLLEILNLYKEIQISPFTFWSFIFAQRGQYNKDKLAKIIAAICENLKITIENTNAIADGLLCPSGCDCDKVIEMWLQNIADASAVSNACWQLFEQLMQDAPEKNKADFNSLIKQIIAPHNNGIRDKAISNLLLFIRPDLTFSINKNEVRDITYKPAYWNTAPLYYIAEIKRKQNFSVFEKYSGGGNHFLQYNAQSKNSISLHYEIVAGNIRGNEPFKIFTEFHIEPYRKNKDEQLLKYLYTELLSCKDEFTSIDTKWFEHNNGFAIRYGNGVSVLDSNGTGKDVENVCKELSEQMTSLFNRIDSKVRVCLDKVESDWLLNEKLEMLKGAQQLILTGAPGTGKTYTAIQMAEELKKQNGGIWEKVQFHPGYDYSDFIIGLKPQVINGQVLFDWKDGIFKEFANNALKERKLALEENRPAQPYVFIIDEINRADLSRVFGEVFSLLEEEYRYPNKEKGITLPGKRKDDLDNNFILPDNLYIIGTMNDIDRSVESMDFALRRRFSWYEVKAQDSTHIIKSTDKKTGNCKIKEEYHTRLERVMTALNACIAGQEAQVNLNLGEEYQLGGAYFLNFAKYQEEKNPWEQLWDNHIAIILNEYLRGRKNRHELLTVIKGIYDAEWSVDK